MSKYTTELRYICENYAGNSESQGGKKVKDILDNSWDKVFDFDFPIFDNSYRKPLCTKILRHFYTREICEETVGLWKLRLEDRMNMLMPYYNKLYESELISISPLVNYRFDTTRNATKTGHDDIGIESSESVEIGSEGSNTRTGGYTDTHDGTVDLEKTGDDTIVKSGNKELEKFGTESDTKTGKIIKDKSGQIEEIGTQEGTKYKETKGQNGTTTENFTDLFTDTPQGNIANMGDSYSSGSSVPIVGSDTAFLTTAEKTSKTIVDGRNVKETDGVSNDYQTSKKTIYGDNNTPLNETEEYSDVANIKAFVDRKDKEVYNNIQDKTTYNSKNTTTNDLEDNRVYNSLKDTKEDSSTKEGSKNENKIITYGSVNEWLEGVVGSKGKSDSELLNEFRSTFLNIDEMLITQLEDLFIMLW